MNRKEVYTAPTLELMRLAMPMSLLNELSYPGEINGNFDDLVNDPDDWYQP